METEQQGLVVSGLLTSTKALRQEIAQRIVEEVTEGERDAIKVFIEVSKAKDLLTQVETNLRPMVAAKGFPKGGLTMYDATLVEKKNPDKYDFESSGDSYYNELVAQEEALKVKIKEREAFLKTLKVPVAITEGEFAGEEIKPPQVLYGAMNFSVTLL